MSVILDNHKLFYASIPKAACTSLKLFFFEIENGFKFREFRTNGVLKGINTVAYAPMLREQFPEQRIRRYRKITVIRDPIKRFLSAYDNKVADRQLLSAIHMQDDSIGRQLPENPPLDVFIELLEKYEKASRNIYHHTRPMVDFLGQDAGFFDRIYRLDQITELAADVARITGTSTPKLMHVNASKSKSAASDLDRKHLAKLIKYYAADYMAFGHILQKPGS